MILSCCYCSCWLGRGIGLWRGFSVDSDAHSVGYVSRSGLCAQFDSFVLPFFFFFSIFLLRMEMETGVADCVRDVAEREAIPVITIRRI